MRYTFKLLLLFVLTSAFYVLATSNSHAKTVEYDLSIAKKIVNFTGNSVEAMTINGSIPGPTLELTEGDHVKIRVHNQMDVETSVHWHGILLPNIEDGVPYLTTPPIRPGSTHLFEFPLRHAGTYWYHSHTGLQEQRGVYGSIVIHPKKETIHADRDYVLILSDWTDENPNEVLRTLKRGSEYYAFKRGNIQSLYGAVKAGALKEVFFRSLDRMPPMDISDVGYDAFLVNGKEQSVLEAKVGETIRLRVINAGASSYFYTQFAGGPMQIVAADGLNVVPVSTNRLLIAVAETYDLLITMPEKQGAFEFRATSQDGSGYASLYLGEGNPVSAPSIAKPNMYKMHAGMDMAMHSPDGKKEQKAHLMKAHIAPMEAMDHTPSPKMKKMSAQHQDKKMTMPMAMNQERTLVPYDMLKSVDSTALDTSKSLREITLTLTGDMERYVWSFDNKVLTEADNILIKKGENVRIIFKNTTMMHHPLHLHGHFFRVLNGQGDFAPLKHTFDVPPMGERVIEFYANEEKDWFLHCHLLYHMKAGMARVVHYKGSQVDPSLIEARKSPNNFLNHDPWYNWGEAMLLSQMTNGVFIAANTRNTLSLDWEKDWDEDEYDVDVTYGRYYSRFLSSFAGLRITDESVRGTAGFKYLLPLLVESEFSIDTEGEAQVVVEKHVQLANRLSLFGESQYHTESRWEWEGGLEWTVNKQLSFVAKYHSEFDAGVGFLVHF